MLQPADLVVGRHRAGLAQHRRSVDAPRIGLAQGVNSASSIPGRPAPRVEDACSCHQPVRQREHHGLSVIDTGVLPVKSPKLPTSLPLSKTWYASSTSDGPARPASLRAAPANAPGCDTRHSPSTVDGPSPSSPAHSLRPPNRGQMSLSWASDPQFPIWSRQTLAQPTRAHG